ISIKFLRTTTLVVGMLKNTTDKDIDIGDVTIQIINKDGSVLSEFTYNMGIIKANTEEKLSIPTADDISNINDIAFIK
ncbi:MAG: FxLYD domain-containing protein, partial [Clostridia bacterium]